MKILVLVYKITNMANVSGGVGGALCVEGNANILIQESQFTSNIAYLSRYIYEDWNNTINTTDNTTYLEIVNRSSDFGGIGGAVCIRNSQNVTINNTQFNNNLAISTGGAVDLVASNSKILNSNFKDNTANWYRGGAIAQEGGYLDVKNSTFLHNIAGVSGGAIFSAWNQAKLNLSNSTFQDNRVNGYFGGSVCLTWTNGGSANITTSNFVNNSAGQGGGIYVDSQHSLNLTNSDFTNNTQAIGTGSLNISTNNNRISGNGVSIQFIHDNLANYNIGDDWRTNNTWTGDNNYTMSIDGHNSVYSINYNFTNTITGKNALIFTGGCYPTQISNNTVIGSNAFKGIVNANAITFSGNTGNNAVMNCNISGNTNPVIMNGTSNRIISCNISENTNGIVVAINAINSIINHNIIYNNGVIDLNNTCVNTNANLNWWGTNNGSSRVSGVALGNWYTLRLYANAFNTTVNTTTNVTTFINVILSYNLTLNTGSKSVQENLLPNFLVMINSSQGNATINADGTASYPVIVNKSGTYYIEARAHNEDVKLNIGINAINPTIAIYNLNTTVGIVVTLIGNLTKEE